VGYHFEGFPFDLLRQQALSRGHLVEQGLGLLQIERVEAFGEPPAAKRTGDLGCVARGGWSKKQAQNTQIKAVGTAAMSNTTRSVRITARSGHAAIWLARAPRSP